MNYRQKYHLDALRRAQGFLETNTATLGTLNASGARAELDDAITQLNSQGVTQQSSILSAKGATSQVGALRAILRDTHMRPIARVAKARLSTVPQFSALTMPDADIDTHGLIMSAMAMATAATPYQSIFTGLGLASDFITQLETAASAVQDAIDTRAEYRVSGAGATAGARAQVQRGRRVLDLLDALVVPQLSANPTLLASWRSAKRVGSKPGAKSARPATTPAAAPAATPAVASAPVVSAATPKASPTSAPSVPAAIPSQPSAPAAQAPTTTGVTGSPAAAGPTTSPATPAPSVTGAPTPTAAAPVTAR